MGAVDNRADYDFTSGALADADGNKRKGYRYAFETLQDLSARFNKNQMKEFASVLISHLHETAPQKTVEGVTWWTLNPAKQLSASLLKLTEVTDRRLRGAHFEWDAHNINTLVQKQNIEGTEDHLALLAFLERNKGAPANFNRPLQVEATKLYKAYEEWVRKGGTPVEYNGVELTKFFRKTGQQVAGWNRDTDIAQRRYNPPTGATMLADFDTHKDLLDENGKPVRGSLPIGQVRMTIRNFVRGLKNAPKIKWYKDIADLRTKNPQLYAEARAAWDGDGFDGLKAVGYSFGDGNVIIFTDMVVNKRHLKAVLAHETFGHYGLRGVLPAKRFNEIMSDLYDRYGSIRQYVDDAMAANPLLTKAVAVEEYLSDYAANVDVGIISRLFRAIRGILRRLGFPFDETSARYMLDLARDYVRRPRGRLFVPSSVGQRMYDIEYGRVSPGRLMVADDVVDTSKAVGKMGRVVRDLSLGNLITDPTDTAGSFIVRRWRTRLTSPTHGTRSRASSSACSTSRPVITRRYISSRKSCPVRRLLRHVSACIPTRCCVRL